MYCLSHYFVNISWKINVLSSKCKCFVTFPSDKKQKSNDEFHFKTKAEFDKKNL